MNIKHTSQKIALARNQEMTKVTHYPEINAYQTKDGSLVRELMHPDQHSNKQQSLAEAIVLPQQETSLHKHLITEELYHITQGHGLITLDTQSFEVNAGDTIHIAPNTAHKIKNTGNNNLKILCCCSPAYSHQDTVLIDEQQA